MGLYFSLRTRDARGSAGTARVPKAPPPPPHPPWGRHPHAGNVQLPAQPSLPGLERGRSEVAPAARKGKLKGEAERDGACSLSPLRAGSATKMNERLARLAGDPWQDESPSARDQRSPCLQVPIPGDLPEPSPSPRPLPPLSGVPLPLPPATELPSRGAPSRQRRGCAGTAAEGEERLQRRGKKKNS